MFRALPDEEKAHEADEEVLVSDRGESCKSVKEVKALMFLAGLVELEDEVILLMKRESVENFSELFKHFTQTIFYFGIGIGLGLG